MEQKRIFKDDKNPISTRELIPTDAPVTPAHVKKFVKERNRRLKAQAKVGKEIGQDKLTCGDIVYFRGRDLYSSSVIDHIGIYLGGGDFIHAEQNSGMVKIDNLMENTYYKKTFAGARRVLE